MIPLREGSENTFNWNNRDKLVNKCYQFQRVFKITYYTRKLENVLKSHTWIIEISPNFTTSLKCMQHYKWLVKLREILLNSKKT